MLSIAAATGRLGVSENTVQLLGQRGELRAYKVGLACKIRREDVNAYLAAVVDQK